MTTDNPVLAHDPHGRRIRLGVYVRVTPTTGVPAYNAWVTAYDEELDAVRVMDKKGRPKLALVSTVKVSRVSGEARKRLEILRGAYEQLVHDTSERSKRTRRLSSK